MLGFFHKADGTIHGLGGFFGLSFVEDSGRLVAFDTSKVLVIIGRELTVIKEGESRTFVCMELSEAIAELGRIAFNLIQIEGNPRPVQAGNVACRTLSDEPDKVRHALSVELDAAAVTALSDRDLELQRRSSALDLREGKLEIRERALEELEEKAATD